MFLKKIQGRMCLLDNLNLQIMQVQPSTYNVLVRFQWTYDSNLGAFLYLKGGCRPYFFLLLILLDLLFFW